ncbi:GFA family protein [Rhizobium leguminosarum]|uniref:GFA family protein n=1 Tax=Rhizobium leguminosarum TaxID=384 RepID=UPI003D78FBAB
MGWGQTMTDDVVRTGGCLCGRVRYEVRGEPYVSGLCHCATCRKLTGSAYSATANWHQPQFRVTGEVQTYELLLPMRFASLLPVRRRRRGIPRNAGPGPVRHQADA